MIPENPLWGAPRILGEILKLGIELSQATVARYEERRRKPAPDSVRLDRSCLAFGCFWVAKRAAESIR